MRRERDWVDEGDRIWRCNATFETDVGNLIFDGTAAFGFKKWAVNDLKAQGDYVYDRGSKKLRLYSAANPGAYYRDIEVALRRNVVDQDNISNVTYEDLAIKFGAAHGFGGTNTAFVTIRNCDISFIGGGDLYMDGRRVRYGNGVEFWANAHDCLVEKCRIWEMYDTALTNQNTFEAARAYNISYRNNVMWNCGYGSFECWSTPASSFMANIRFENNTCAGAGEGWGRPPQRPDPSGFHIVLDQCAVADDPAGGPRVRIRNNVFFRSNLALSIQHASKWNSATIDYNCWYQPVGLMVNIGQAAKGFTMARFGAYQKITGFDAHSLASDPEFVNPAERNYHLGSGSPCVAAGSETEVVDDFDGVLRPSGRPSDMGAFAAYSR